MSGANLPTAGVVQVWRVSIPDAPIAELDKLLAKDERERAARFVFDRDRNQFIVVRGLLRRLLGEYLNRSPTDIRFTFGPQGKPMLANESGLRFNASHSAEVGLLAFCCGRDVGVDVERVDRATDIADLARHCFSSSEQESLQALSEGGQLERFFQLWTAKEAYIKALGGGLSIPLQDFSIDVRRDSDCWAIAGSSGISELPRPLVVRQIPLPSAYAGAVTASGSDWTVQTADI